MISYYNIFLSLNVIQHILKIMLVNIKTLFLEKKHSSHTFLQFLSF